jgi:Uma2 family endonuclease
MKTHYTAEDDPMTALTRTARAKATVPPLQAGDHLTRDEFERRYETMPDVKKAELIEGVVYMPSPVRADQHGNLHADLIWWLGHFRCLTPGVRVSDNATVRLDLDNEPQPDAVLYTEPARGGRVVITEDGYIEGAPELVAEVSASTVSIDLHTKLRVYRRNGIQEYIVWRVQDDEIDWFALHNGQYDRLAPDAGIYRSEVYPGLWLDAVALLRGDLAAVLQVLQQGLASPEHATFVGKLQAAAGPAGN